VQAGGHTSKAAVRENLQAARSAAEPRWVEGRRTENVVDAFRTEDFQTVIDPLFDVPFSQGDVTSGGVNISADGFTRVGVNVMTFDSPFGPNWSLGATAIDWIVDTTGDREVDFDVLMFNDGGVIVGGVLDAANDLVCLGDVAWDPGAKFYGVAVKTSCIGDPSEVRWGAGMLYEVVGSGTASFDIVPNDDWAGPVHNSATATPPHPVTGFAPVTPTRVFDTRGDASALRQVPVAKVGGESVLEVAVTNLPGLVPSTGVGAVSLNVTVTDPEGPGFVTVYPCGQRNLVSNLNFVAGQTVPNAVIAPVSATGTVCFSSSQMTNLIADVNGWFAG
jgi:hypothetical protein